MSDTLAAAVGAALAPVYRWLAEDLGFPVHMCCLEKPAWIDMRLLAAAWWDKELRDESVRTDPDATVEGYVDWLLEETGWTERRAAS